MNHESELVIALSLVNHQQLHLHDIDISPTALKGICPICPPVNDLVIGYWSVHLDHHYDDHYHDFHRQHRSTLEMDQAHQGALMQVIECTTIPFQLCVL